MAYLKGFPPASSKVGIVAGYFFGKVFTAPAISLLFAFEHRPRCLRRLDSNSVAVPFYPLAVQLADNAHRLFRRHHARWLGCFGGAGVAGRFFLRPGNIEPPYRIGPGQLVQRQCPLRRTGRTGLTFRSSDIVWKPEEAFKRSTRFLVFDFLRSIRRTGKFFDFGPWPAHRQPPSRILEVFPWFYRPASPPRRRRYADWLRKNPHCIIAMSNIGAVEVGARRNDVNRNLGSVRNCALTSSALLKSLSALPSNEKSASPESGSREIGSGQADLADSTRRNSAHTM